MAGRFRRRTIAAIAHSVVDKPRAGNTPKAAPSATLKAIFSGVTPCRSNSRIGRTSRRLKNPSFTMLFSMGPSTNFYFRISNFAIFSLLLCYCAGVVMNDFPSIGEALPHQRKHSSGFIFLPLQVPSSEDERRVRPQKPKLQFRKIQLPHRSFVWIVPLVSCLDAIPTACYSATPGKRQLRRMPITHQKGVHVAAVPRGLLDAENGTDRIPVRPTLIHGLGKHSILDEEKHPHCQCNRHQNPAVIRSHVLISL